jgi:cadmium resistance protein CadD (predicted permease)
VPSFAAVIVVASLAYLGTMCDNFVAFTAQLSLTERARYRRLTTAQVTGVLAMVAIAFALGRVLKAIPLGWFALLALAPFGFAVHAWRVRHREPAAHQHGALAIFVLTVSIGGDNIAVWTPLFRGGGLAHGALALGAFAVWEVVFVAASRALSVHRRVVAWSVAHAPRVMPVVYAGLGVLVLVECHPY